MPAARTAGDTGPTAIDTGPCVFDLAQWCHHLEPSGPTTAAAACADPTIDELMAATGLAWHGRCADATGVTLDFVNYPDGYSGGPYWYFDASGAFVAFTFGTDYGTWCTDEPKIAFGFDPSCGEPCVVAASTDYEPRYAACP